MKLWIIEWSDYEGGGVCQEAGAFLSEEAANNWIKEHSDLGDAVVELEVHEEPR